MDSDGEYPFFMDKVEPELFHIFECVKRGCSVDTGGSIIEIALCIVGKWLSAREESGVVLVIIFHIFEYVKRGEGMRLR